MCSKDINQGKRVLMSKLLTRSVLYRDSIDIVVLVALQIWVQVLTEVYVWTLWDITDHVTACLRTCAHDLSRGSEFSPFYS
jgi:hypothetical protein